VVRMLELAHREHGKAAWAELFSPAIGLASNGFAISGRLSDAIVANRTFLLADADAAAYFYNADLSPKALGTNLKNPAYAESLRAIATGGANAFYTGPIAQGIVNEIRASTGTGTSTFTPGLTQMSDLAAYQPKKRAAVCSTYRGVEVCGMPPPSSGGIAVAQTLGILENFNLSAGVNAPTGTDENGARPSVQAVHLVSEAQRLAYADRNQYVADTDFVALPGAGLSSMLSKTYLAQRAGLINLTRSMGTAAAGTFGSATAMGVHTGDGNGTTHITIVDREGNVVSFTTTVESSMGAFRMANGFILNNQLTDFSPTPSDATGPIANRVAGNKRPRSSMAPTIAFRAGANGQREFAFATGSPGGAAIIQFVTKTTVGLVDWGLSAQQATSMMNFGAGNAPTTGIGGEHPHVRAANNGEADPVAIGLRALGHTVSTAAQSSGVATIVRGTFNGRQVLTGGADPRREGIVLGDGIQP
jgi:gamma-glutamyltranspeptidase / glutathione hydrolase